MTAELKQPVKLAIDEIRAQFAPSPLLIEADGNGGAHVIVEKVPLGTPFVQSFTWLGGHLPAQLPYSDVYPLFVRGDLDRCDSTALTAPITGGHQYLERNAVQISRRSNQANFDMQTASMKFQKVLSWMLERK